MYAITGTLERPEPPQKKTDTQYLTVFCDQYSDFPAEVHQKGSVYRFQGDTWRVGLSKYW